MPNKKAITSQFQQSNPRSRLHTTHDLVQEKKKTKNGRSNFGLVLPGGNDFHGSVLPVILHPAGDGCDQRGALPTAVLRLVERHLTLGGQILQRLLHDFGETTQRGGEEMIATFPLPPPSPSLKSRYYCSAINTLLMKTLNLSRKNVK